MKFWLPTPKSIPLASGGTFKDSTLQANYILAREAFLAFLSNSRMEKREELRRAAARYLSSAHAVKLSAYGPLSVQILWLWSQYGVRAATFIALRILMIFIALFETYPGKIPKPGSVVAITVGVKVLQLGAFLYLHHLAKKLTSSSVQIFLSLLGAITALGKTLELWFISQQIPNSGITTARRKWSFGLAIIIEILGEAVLFFASRDEPETFLGEEGDLFDEVNLRSFAWALTTDEKYDLLKALVMGQGGGET